jgi:hypothetical protein
MDGWSRELIRATEAEIEIFRRGDGVPVVMHPSLGRGAQDFDDLKMPSATPATVVTSPGLYGDLSTLVVTTP